MDSQRQLKSQYRWKGPARFKRFFEHNRFGFALKETITMGTVLFLVGFVGAGLSCLVGSLFSVIDSCRGLNPFTWGFLVGAGWFVFLFPMVLTWGYNDRFEKTPE
jgi:hypothetical protein